MSPVQVTGPAPRAIITNWNRRAQTSSVARCFSASAPHLRPLDPDRVLVPAREVVGHEGVAAAVEDGAHRARPVGDFAEPAHVGGLARHELRAIRSRGVARRGRGCASGRGLSGAVGATGTGAVGATSTGAVGAASTGTLGTAGTGELEGFGAEQRRGRPSRGWRASIASAPRAATCRRAPAPSPAVGHGVPRCRHYASRDGPSGAAVCNVVPSEAPSLPFCVPRIQMRVRSAG